MSANPASRDHNDSPFIVALPGFTYAIVSSSMPPANVVPMRHRPPEDDLPRRSFRHGKGAWASFAWFGSI
jgi:hypothetical protein